MPRSCLNDGGREVFDSLAPQTACHNCFQPFTMAQVSYSLCTKLFSTIKCIVSKIFYTIRVDNRRWCCCTTVTILAAKLKTVLIVIFGGKWFATENKRSYMPSYHQQCQKHTLPTEMNWQSGKNPDSMRCCWGKKEKAYMLAQLTECFFFVISILICK